MTRLISIAIFATMVISGCGHSPHWHAASTVPLAPDGYDVIGPVEGQDCLWQVLGIPVTNSNETTQAIRNALQSVGGADALVNVTADTFGQYYVLFGKRCIKIDATAVRIR